MAAYLEEYIDSVSSLPAELQQNFRKLRELDMQSHELRLRVEAQSAERLEALTAAEQAGQATVSEVQAGQIEADEKVWLGLADEKVALAVRTYELVDSHIRRLDKDLRKFEEELKQERELLGGAVAEQKMESAAGRTGRDENVKALRKRGVATQNGAAAVHGVDLDLPIDPNEPTYCYCNQVSYGEMIACDNPECKIEWFHFDCVRIGDRPKGRWFCPDCRAQAPPRRRIK